MSGATLLVSNQDKYPQLFTPPTGAVIHQRGALDGDLSPPGGQPNLILTHSSNIADSAHRASA